MNHNHNTLLAVLMQINHDLEPPFKLEAQTQNGLEGQKFRLVIHHDQSPVTGWVEWPEFDALLTVLIKVAWVFELNRKLKEQNSRTNNPEKRNVPEP